MDKTIYGETIYISEPFYGWNFDIFHSDEIGKILYGQYKILKLLGKGSKSKVLLVEKIKTNEKFVAKIMLKKELEEFLINEYEVLKSLDYQGIIKVCEYKKSNEIEPSCLIMEYFEGKNIKELYYEENIEKMRILEIFLKLAYALKYLHEKLLVHWDIKPENILVNSDNSVKLIDFGLSYKSYEKKKATGTLKYMSPERILGEKTDIRSEIYSYFLSLYEGITGGYPFVGGNLEKKIINEKIKEFNNCNILIKKFLEKGLEKNLELRYANFSEVIEDLKDLIFMNKEIVPFLDKNNRGSLTNHYILSGRNKEKCDYYFDLLYMESGLKSQIEGNYSRINPFLEEHLESIEYDLEDRFDYINFFNYLEKLYEDLTYELLELYINSQIQELIRRKEKELSLVNIKGDEAFSLRDYSRALENYRKSSIGGSPYGNFRLGELYEKGLGVAIDFEKALEFYTKSKKMNYIPAMKKIGELYFGGKIVSKNYDEAFKLFKKVSQMGDAESQELLGDCYKNGLGVTVNYDEAFKWYYSSYEKGNIRSSGSLGYLYENGFGVEKNIEKAIFFYEKGISLGDIVSAMALALIKEKDKIYLDAFELFEKGAYAGNDLGQFKIGQYYYEGKGIEKSLEKGIFWLEKAVEKDNLESLNYLGKVYENENPEKAVEYYRRALKYHDKDANFNIGLFYLNEDFERGKKYLNRAFEFGRRDAFYMLGKAYLEGVYTEKNIKETKYYLDRASEEGDLESKFLLGKLLLDSEIGVRNFSKAFNLLEEVSISGQKEAMLILADLLEKGLGIAKNTQEAEKWRKLAQDNGEEQRDKVNIFNKIKKFLHR